MKPALCRIAITGGLLFLISCGGQASAEPIPSAHTSMARQRQRLHGWWIAHEKGHDAGGPCIIDCEVQYRADGTFLYYRTFHPLKHRPPTWSGLVNSGKWRITHGLLTLEWTPTGESPNGWTTRSPIFLLTKSHLRYQEGANGVITFDRERLSKHLHRSH